MSKKIKISAAAALAALSVTVYSDSASAKWVVKSDAWCKSRGFKPVCEIYEKDEAVIGAKVDADITKPKVGQIRGGQPKK